MSSYERSAWAVGGRSVRPVHLLAALALGLVVVQGPAAAASGGTWSVSPGDQADFVSLINGLRSSHGAGRLTPDAQLTGIADRWAASMAAAGSISHNPALAADVTEDWQKLGENVGVGPSVSALERAFVASPHHYQNLVDPSYTRVGVGVVRRDDGALYVAEDFLEPPTPVAPVAPAPMAGSAPPAAVAGPPVTAPPPTTTITTPPTTTAVALPTERSVASGAGGRGSGRQRPLLPVVLVAGAATIVGGATRRRSRRARGRRAESVADRVAAYAARTPPTRPVGPDLDWIPAATHDDPPRGELAQVLRDYSVTAVPDRCHLADRLAPYTVRVALTSAATIDLRDPAGASPGALPVDLRDDEPATWVSKTHDAS